MTGSHSIVMSASSAERLMCQRDAAEGKRRVVSDVTIFEIATVSGVYCLWDASYTLGIGKDLLRFSR